LGGLQHKQHYDALNEADHQLVLNFWNIATTISPIQKDVKQQHIRMKTWEVHPTHYLQKTQVCNNFILFSAMELNFFGSFLLESCNSCFLSIFLVLM
jgi:hypothetical protein